MPSKTLYMETTEIAAERTAAEITVALVSAGATQINTEYAEGKITGLRWIMRAGQRDTLFAMPARVEPVYQILEKRSGYRYGTDYGKLREKAQRVVWRQLLRWVQAQLAMIECGMIEPVEVFLPFAQTPSGQTLFEAFRDNGMRLLAAPEREG